MTAQKKLELTRAILSMENPYPKDDLIESYADFLKVRDYLACYQFNPIVFSKLLDIAIDIWKSNKRVNKLLLLTKIKQYLYSNAEGRKGYYDTVTYQHDLQLTLETSKKIFQLFQNSFDEVEFIKAKQIEDIRATCNLLLIKVGLSSKEEKWLCDNITKSDCIVNRVLRYPIKSDVISNWSRNNLHNDIIRNRRAEQLSWMIDQDPTFVVDTQTLTDDFEFLNAKDLQAIQNYKDELAACKIINEELGDYLNNNMDNDVNISKHKPWENRVAMTPPELKLTQRSYTNLIPIEDLKGYFERFPDIQKYRVHFYANIKTHQQLTMIWAIGYSRLSNDVKYSLLKNYYNLDTHRSMLRVCSRSNNIKMLKWILAKQT